MVLCLHKSIRNGDLTGQSYRCNYSNVVTETTSWLVEIHKLGTIYKTIVLGLISESRDQSLVQISLRRISRHTTL